ncbi:hypothetical protein H920_15184 [Fukomys damarensis]|uniref:Uncharacterized protein n=1 Tax=Fukomys damarensis TaxID=885580 RepID=A0A091CV13_FUKDA|nr:hypothetical protein H920_15184 [Fukomys damarensis]
MGRSTSLLPSPPPRSAVPTAVYPNKETQGIAKRGPRCHQAEQEDFSALELNALECTEEEVTHASAAIYATPGVETQAAIMFRDFYENYILKLTLAAMHLQQEKAL